MQIQRIDQIAQPIARTVRKVMKRFILFIEFVENTKQNREDYVPNNWSCNVKFSFSFVEIVARLREGIMFINGILCNSHQRNDKTNKHEK